ncbi:MAG: class I SAM-dependent methyltransferase [Candidatus Binataceae bacterium]
MNSQEKQRAIEIHDADAPVFDERYHLLGIDPYSSTFTYGRKKISELLDAQLKALPKGARVLDAGCGTGYDVARLTSLGFKVSGLEPAESMRVIAQRNNPLAHIIAGDVENLPFLPGSFELVIAIEVIRYLRDPEIALSQIERVMKPGGRAVITAAPIFSLNGYSLINAVTARVKLPTFSKIRHFFLTEREMRRIAVDVGFRDVKIHAVFIGPWHPLGRLSPRTLSLALRRWERIDDCVADLPVCRSLSNHFVMVVEK